MQKEIDCRKGDGLPGHDKIDMFSYLLRANLQEKASTNLNDRELTSNTFAMLFAGHETTSKALSFVIGMLACHPAEQEKLSEHVRSVLVEDKQPTIEDYPDLAPVLHCVLEVTRLFPVAPYIARESTEYTTIRVPGLDEPLAVPKNTLFIGDIVGLNYDPERFEEPSVFRPSRWAEKAELTMDDFITWGLGAHACIGRKFALYEMVCFVALFVKTWKICPVLKDGEGLQQWRRRVLEERLEIGITFGPHSVPLALTRR
ncbi:cytochrome P450 [Calocera viscosa TUFC12733]|uniref:Cytochrome P450 n=1 Tax=Calocera viscosa (strain TUFC12733) TaxID=1330018 RepID=A0A167Q1U7_CALVF|nr:cytochrome P450 [Calocera viscosa TUFC12733]